MRLLTSKLVFVLSIQLVATERECCNRISFSSASNRVSGKDCTYLAFDQMYDCGDNVVVDTYYPPDTLLMPFEFLFKLNDGETITDTEGCWHRDYMEKGAFFDIMVNPSAETDMTQPNPRDTKK